MPSYRIHLVSCSGGNPDCLWVLDDQGRGECLRIVRTSFDRFLLSVSQPAYITEIPAYLNHEYYESISFEDFVEFVALLDAMVAKLHETFDLSSQHIPIDWVSSTVREFFRNRHADRVNQ